MPDFAPQIGFQLPLPRDRPCSSPASQAAIPGTDALRSAEDSQWVETEGIVRQVRLVEGILLLDVAVAGGRLKAVVPDIPGTVPSRFVDAEIRVRGACGAIYNQ